PEGQSSLGICLLELGRGEAGLLHLERACQLDPGEPLHQWNLAAGAHKLARVGRSYLALRAYLEGEDESPDAEKRRAEAAAYLAAYDNAATAAHPGVDPILLARGEEVFLTALAALSAGRAEAAAEGFERVLGLVPDHHQAWSNLGAAYLLLELRAEAI